MNQHRKGNSFDQGVPGDPRLHDAIARRTPKAAGMQVTHTHSSTILAKKKQLKAPTIKPPLWITLMQIAGDPIVWKVYAQYGHVVPRHNTTADTGEPIAISGLPTFASPLTVVVNTKLWVKETINDEGKVTAAALESGTSWPEDTPPELKGGDNASGTTGYRHIQIAEIIADPASTATPPPLIRNQLHTGHVDHFQNELCENIDTSGAAILKEWDPTTGKWMFRTIVAGDGIALTENADSIEVAISDSYLPPHPWKATANGGSVDIAAGKVLGIRDAGTPGATPWNFIYLSYAGGTIAFTGAGYIYAIFAITPRAIGEDAAGAGYISASQEPTSISVEFSADDPTTVALASSGEVCIPICEVAGGGGTASVEDQILTHNPMLTIETTVSMP